MKEVVNVAIVSWALEMAIRAFDAATGALITLWFRLGKCLAFKVNRAHSLVRTLILRSRHFLHPVEGRPRYTIPTASELENVPSYTLKEDDGYINKQQKYCHLEIDCESRYKAVG